MLTELLGGPGPAVSWHGNVAFAIFLIGGAGGGLGCGVPGEGVGRVRVLYVRYRVSAWFSALAYSPRWVWGAAAEVQTHGGAWCVGVVGAGAAAAAVGAFGCRWAGATAVG